MRDASIIHLSVCGVDELSGHAVENHTHVLSLINPNRPEIDAFQAFGAHTRWVVNFHDIILAADGKIMPTQAHVAEILKLGRYLLPRRNCRLLVHCHMGVSRSTAAMLALLAQTNPQDPVETLFGKLRAIRPQAWPNSVMVQHADALLGYEGELIFGLRRHYGHQLQEAPEIGALMARLDRGQEIEMAL